MDKAASRIRLLFALQKDYYCYATVALLKGKCTTVA